MKEPLQYVQITKTDGLRWYNDKIGHVLPVVDETQYYYIFLHTTHQRGGLFIEKADCEVVSLGDALKGPCSPLVSAAQDTAAITIAKQAEVYAEKEEFMGSPRGGTWNLAKKDFEAGARWMKEQLQGSAPLPEGQHLTQEQKEELPDAYDYLMGRGYDNVARLLEQMFPLVFAPAKTTYKVGQEFTDKTHSYKLIHNIGGTVSMLVNDNYIWADIAVKVKDSYAITEEEMNQITDHSLQELILLPESTNQSA